MTKTKIVALLSVVALLASLPLTVVLAQQAPAPPFRVVGTAMIDGEDAAEGTMVVAMVGDMEVGMDTVGMGGLFMQHWTSRAKTERWSPSCSRWARATRPWNTRPCRTWRS